MNLNTISLADTFLTFISVFLGAVLLSCCFVSVSYWRVILMSESVRPPVRPSANAPKSLLCRNGCK